MSNESTKTRKVRNSDFLEKYFKKDVLDIGGGSDPVVKHAEVFDLKDGDAQYIIKYKEIETYNCIHSSHCLEHMQDVPLALKQWWQLVRPGGYMIIVVPHEDLYEQRCWPSIFNEDHKATFRINQDSSWPPISYDLLDLCQHLPNSTVIETAIHDLKYDYNLQYKKFSKILRKIYRWQYSNNTIKRLFASKIYKKIYNSQYVNSNNNTGIPIDQTGGDALAQIQVVLQKKMQKQSTQ